jgi:toxin YoeB
MSQKIIFTQMALEEYISWQSEDKKTLKRINLLLQDIMRNGNIGIGKPEKLKGDLSDYWSRCIDDKIALFIESLKSSSKLCNVKRITPINKVACPY